jgi:L-fucose isomerase-like protein
MRCEHTIGFIPIARPTFDIPLAQEVTGQARQRLQAAGLTLVQPEGLVTTLEEVRAAADLLAGRPLDMLLVFQATFADSTLVMALAEGVDAPLLLWAVPEARTGDRLRLNSLCGITLGGHALTRVGYRYDYVYAAPSDAAAVERISALARAGRVKRLLQATRIGRVGVNPDGFESCMVNGQGLADRLGVTVVQVELEHVFAEARASAPDLVDATFGALAARVAGLDDLDRTAVRGTLGTYLALQAMTAREGFAGLAVRCWPQFFTDLGCAACGALSMLNDELIPAACETDVNGALTQLMLQWLSDEPAFGADMVAFDRDTDSAVLWHCGKAPLAMCDPDFQPRATIHSNRRLPLLMEFPLKPGRVTLARLSEADGRFRLVIGAGEMLRAEPSFSGTSGVIRFDRPALDVLDTIMSAGLEHHVALTYGDHAAALVKLAELLAMPILRL